MSEFADNSQDLETEDANVFNKEDDGRQDEEARQAEEAKKAEEDRHRFNRGAIEAMLFVSDEPVTSSRLSDMLDLTLSETDEILCELANEYDEEERGIQLREVAGGWRLYTHPAYHDAIEKYVLSWDTQKLSQAALEVLAVIAYNQPTTRAIVSSIRGVNSDAVISSLVEKGLIREAGRENSVGQPILYATTRTFLEKFGLRSIKDLPPLEDFAANEQTRQLIIERLSANSGLSDDFDIDDDSEDEDSDVYEIGDDALDDLSEDLGEGSGDLRDSSDE
ncbi:MAG: SMC-Scp complex subunit ScpB [Coriobacteriales bacterium]|jgi:segregation and condensation protein B